jgi:hypothetical protein
MEQAQKMKRALTDFFPLCRKWLIVALLAVNLSGCAILDDIFPIKSDADFAVAYIGTFTVGILTAPIWVPIWVVIGSTYEAKEWIDDTATKRAWKSLAQKAHNYLQTACEKDERLFIKPGIVLNNDILVLDNRKNALLPLLEMAPKNIAVPDKIIQYRRESYYESREESIRAFREIQYGYALPWDAGNLSNDPSNARYTLTIEDISTLEDRAHWVGRGRLRLMERESGEIVAEYVGFQANLCPGIQRPSRYQRWENISWNFYCEGGSVEVCPSMENEWFVAPEFLRKIQSKE